MHGASNANFFFKETNHSVFSWGAQVYASSQTVPTFFVQHMHGALMDHQGDKSRCVVPRKRYVTRPRHPAVQVSLDFPRTSG